MILAEASNGFMGALVYALLALVGGAGAAFGIYFGFREPKKQRTTIEDQPVEVRKAPKRFNHDLAESRHAEVVGRLDAHDAEFDELWRTMRAEDSALRTQTAEEFKKIERSLGRIEGHLGTKPS